MSFSSLTTRNSTTLYYLTTIPYILECRDARCPWLASCLATISLCPLILSGNSSVCPLSVPRITSFVVNTGTKFLPSTKRSSLTVPVMKSNRSG